MAADVAGAAGNKNSHKSVVTGLVRDSLRYGHKHIFQIDFLFAEHFEPEAVLYKDFSDKAAVVYFVIERDAQRVVVARLDLENVLVAFKLFLGGLRHAV